MCVDVDEPWEAAWTHDDATLSGTNEAWRDNHCYECGRCFEPDELHHLGLYGPTVYDDENGEEKVNEAEAYEMRFCFQCIAARSWLDDVCHSWLYGGVEQDLRDHFEEMPPICSLALGRLVVGMKRGWRRRDGTLYSASTVEAWARTGAQQVIDAIKRGEKVHV